MKTIQVVQPSMPPYAEFCEEIKDMWESRWLTHTGPKHQKLEKELCDYLHVDNVSLFANGHLALELAINALELTGEVITTPFTFASTTQAIVRNGLIPVFCDINEDDYTLDVRKIEPLITERTSAILPVHVYGSVCDYAEIDRIAKKHNLKVIYDAAHAFGVEVNGIGVGNLGDISMFSFHSTKVFHTFEGGGLTFANEDLKTKFARLRQFGMEGKESVPIIGTNAKMTEAHAAMGLCNLKHIDEEISKRKTVFERYLTILDGVKGIQTLQIKEKVKHNYAYFPAVFDGYKYSRDEIADSLAKDNIFARKYFYPLTNEFECYRDYPTADALKTPVAKKVSDNVLCLPMYADLALEDVDRICTIILR